MSAAEPGAPLLVEVDPFDLPEWLGESDVVWSGGSGLRTAHLVEGALSGGPGQETPCDLLAVDEAYPTIVATDDTRVRAHRAWRHGQVLVVLHRDRVTLAAPGTRWTSEGVLDAMSRLARAVGASPEHFAVHLRIGDDQ